MKATRFLLFLLVVLMIVFSSEIAFHGVSADYAPEKTDIDDEARQEMNLEPRSSIPHPRNSIPVTPAAYQVVHLYPNHNDTTVDNSESLSNSMGANKDNGNITTGEKMNHTVIVNNTTMQAESTPAVTPAVNASNAISPNTTSASFLPRQANQQLSSNEVSQTEQNNVSEPHTEELNEETEDQQTNVSSPVTNGEQEVEQESVSLRKQSKLITKTKSIQDTKENNEEKEDENGSVQNSNTTYKPTTAAFKTPTNKPTTIATSAADDKLDKNKASNFETETDKMEANDNSLPKENLDMGSGSGSGSGNEDDEEPVNQNNVPHINDIHKEVNDNDDGEDDEDDDDDESGSGEKDQKDQETPFLHDNHTLTSTNGALKIGNKQAKPLEDDTQNDKEPDVEDALDRETNDEDNEESQEEEERKENLQDKPTVPPQQNSERLDENEDEEDKDNLGIKKTPEGKANVEMQKPAQESNADKDVSKVPEKTSDAEMHKPVETKADNDTDKPLQTNMEMTKAPERNSNMEGHKETSDNTETHKESQPIIHHDAKTKELKKTSTHKPENTANVVPNHPVTKQENKKIIKKPLLKYIHRANLHSKTISTVNKTTPHKCNSDEIKTGYSLKGGTRAGHVNDLGGSSSIHDCIKRCCHKKVCDVALLLDGRCFGVSCFSKELCEPTEVPHPHYVSSQIAFLTQAERRTEVGRARPEFDCKYGELTIRNNHRWSGELCGGVLTCKNGIVRVETCPGIPPKPKYCANPKLYVKQRPGQCCIKKWQCKDKSCMYGKRKISHGVSLSDPLCTGIITCLNGHLKTTTCPDIPTKPHNCANPKLEITTIPGKCCQRKWACLDKSCTYNKLKVDHGERLTDASCAVVMECNNGFLNFKHCPSPPAIPNGCLNPKLAVKRVLGECCDMKWTCAADI